VGAGRRHILGAVAVALVGSRAGSPYACEVAERLGSDLSERGVTVVSGCAWCRQRGPQGGLEGRGGSVGVLGCGLDVVYPPEHRDLIHEVRSRGALLSEFGPSVPPRRFHSPRRNGSLAASRLPWSWWRQLTEVGRSLRPVARPSKGGRPCAYSRWGKGCGDCGRYPGGDRCVCC